MNGILKKLMFVMLLILVATPVFAATSTTIGKIVSTPSDTSIWVSASYTDDSDVNNTLTIIYKPSTVTLWSSGTTTNLNHAASPYKLKITGLTNGTAYDVRVQFNDAGGVTGTNPQDFMRVIPSTMMHNSENATTGTRKWDAQGGWGIPGGKYGQFECGTCHQPRATNIKSVKTNVATPDGTNWGSVSSPTVTVLFRSLTTPDGFGDDSDNHTTSKKVCEVCHSQTDYHRYNASVGQVNNTHNNQANCTTTCHKHDVGFKGAGGTDCASCHGAATPSGYWSVNLPDGTPGNAPGAHAKHYGTDVWPVGSYDDSNQSVSGSYYRFSCGKCHEPYANMSNAPNPNITLSGASLPPSTGGTYAANVCSNVYCHGSTMVGGTKVNLAWTTTLACGGCHGATAATYTKPGAHQRHTGTVYGASQGMNLACTDCHGANQGNTGHVDGSVSWSLNTTKNLFGASAVYNGQQAGATGAVAPSAAYSQCNNVYCHSSVQNNGGTALGTPVAVTWGTTPVVCDSCHGQAGKGTGQPVTGSHWRHASTLSFGCDVCHLNYGDEHPQHANYLIDSGISATYNGVAAATYSQQTHTPGQGGYGTCSSVYCHGSYVGSGGTNTTPTWGGTAACGTCHLASSATPATTPNSGSHQKHAGNWTTANMLACTKCHGPQNGIGAAGHMNLHVDWRFDTADNRVGANAKYYGSSIGSTGNKAPSASFGSCSSVYCHSTVQSDGGNLAGVTYSAPVWGSVGTAQCGSCHNNPPSTGKHAKHASTTTGLGYVCGTCHNGAGDETIYHARGTINLAINTVLYGANASYSQGNQGPGTGYGQCYSVYCHGGYPNSGGTNTQPFWTTVGGPSMACGTCHRATSANPPSTQAHPRHAGNWTTAVNLACTDCHGPVNGTGAAGHMDLHVDWRLNTADARMTTALYRGAAVGSTGYSAQGTTAFGNCTNVYCHSTVQNDGGTAAGTFATPNWGSTGSGACGTCHGVPPTTGKHAKHASTTTGYGYVCGTCHNGAGDGTIYHSRGTINLRINTIAWAAWGTATYSQGEHKGAGGGYGNCSNVYCHGNYVNSGATNTTPTWTTVGGASIACGTCHRATSANPPTTGSHPKHAGAWTTSNQLACTQCHGPNNGIGTIGHVDLHVDWRFNTADTRLTTAKYNGTQSGTTAAKAGSTTLGSCTSVYCHSTVQSDGGNLAGVTYASPVWGSSGTAQCGSCHGNPPTTGKHGKHAGTLGYLCGTCHNGVGDETVYHARGTINLAINTILYGPNAYYNQGNQGPGTGYGQCFNVYCHGGFVTASSGGTNTSPFWTTVGGPSMACGTCHRATSANPPTTGSHQKHAGNWSTSGNMPCTLCHGTSNGIGTIGHMDLNVQWSFDTANDFRVNWFTVGRYKGATMGSTGAKAVSATFGACTNIYCHSNVQANGGNAGPTNYASPVWGSSGSAQCGSCHAMPNTTGGHVRHEAVYGTTSGACQICHFGAGDETPYHARGTINLRIGTTYWANLTTATYSQGEHKGAGGGYGNCNNTVCHGGPSKIWNSLTASYQCTKCHGTDWGSTGSTNWTSNLYKAAPGADQVGHDNWGSVGTYVGRVSNNPQVGAHDAHLRALSTISLPIGCNQCHVVPGGVTSVGHNNTGRRAEITWGSLANWGTTVPAASWSSNALTQCSNVYCHGGKMKNGDTSGFNRTPSWTSGGYLGTIVWQAITTQGGCGMCHGAPPTAGTQASTHSGQAFPSSCTGCHPHVAANGSFTTIAFHIDGIVQASGGDCLGCHNAQKTKTKGTVGTIRQIVGTGGDFNMGAAPTGSRHLYGATTILKWDCIVCHMEGWATTSSVGGTSSFHNDTQGLIDLRNVDNWTTGWSVNNRAWTTTDYTNLDTFCLSCHDANGAAGINVNATNNGLNLTNTRALTPFNTSDGTTSLSGSTVSANAGPRTHVIDVKTKFFAGNGGTEGLAGGSAPTWGTGGAYNGNPSQHAVIGHRYSTVNASWTAAAWASFTLRKTNTNINVSRETSLLSCADCHVLDTGSGAHGGVRKYNMWASTSVTACTMCHANGVYNAVSNAASRFAHNTDSGNIGTTSTAYGLPAGGYNCQLCHASWNLWTTVTRNDSYGGIHGSWSSTATYGWMTVGGTPVNAYRFNPGTWRKSNETDWTTARATCYFNAGAADNFSSCTSHSSATGRAVTTAANYVRPVKY